MIKKVIITGIAGQDGSYLANYLINKGYRVIGILKKKKLNNLDYFNIKNKIKYLYCDLSNFKKISSYIKKIKPYLFFNLAGVSSLEESFQNPIYTDKINNSAVLNILENIKKYSKKTRFFQASSSEIFSEKEKKKVNENSKFNPKTPYSIAKLSALHYVNMYRDYHNIYAVNGILFNHESPLRKNNFITKKIIKELVKYKLKKNKNKIIKLGNVNSLRDWGDAEDYVKVIYKTLKINKAYNFIICTGIKRSIKDFINIVCKQLNIKIKWLKNKKTEIALDTETNKIIIKSSKKLFRDDSFYNFFGDNSRAKNLLKWNVDTSINKLIQKMINFELRNQNQNYNNLSKN